MQTSEGMYTADVTSGQLRAVEEKLMGRIEMLECIIEEMIDRIPEMRRSTVISAAVHLLLEQRRKRQEEEEAACKERSFKSMEGSVIRAIWERRADEPSAVERHPKDVRGYP